VLRGLLWDFFGLLSKVRRTVSAGIDTSRQESSDAPIRREILRFPVFTSGPGARKARDLAANPACSVPVRPRGIDLTLEGHAHRITDADTLERVAATYRDGGWPVTVEGDAYTAPYSAPSAGPAPWHLYRLTLHTAIGVATAEPHGATRWDFDH
jgi:hypothetical protein